MRAWRSSCAPIVPGSRRRRGWRAPRKGHAGQCRRGRPQAVREPAGAAAAHERGRIRGDIPRPAARPPLSGPEARALAALAAAGAGELAAPLLGVAPWWPLCAVGALHWAATGRTLTGIRVPWRLAGGVGLATAALAGTTALAGLGRLPAPATAGELVAPALAVGVLAAATNNLPVGAALGRLLPGPPAHAAVVGLSTGALATRRGSLATILALDLAGEAGASAGRGYRRVWAPTALAATVAAAGIVAITAR